MKSGKNVDVIAELDSGSCSGGYVLFPELSQAHPGLRTDRVSTWGLENLCAVLQQARWWKRRGCSPSSRACSLFKLFPLQHRIGMSGAVVRTLGDQLLRHGVTLIPQEMLRARQQPQPPPQPPELCQPGHSRHPLLLAAVPPFCGTLLGSAALRPDQRIRL